MQVLQLFHRYLDESSHWVHDLLKPLEDVELTVAAPVWLNPHFEIAGMKKVPIPHTIDIQKKQGFWFRQKIKRNYRHIKSWMMEHAKDFDLAHAHFSFVGWEYAKLCHTIGKPLLVSFYGYDYEHLPHTLPIWRDRYRELFLLADAFIAEGGHGAETLARIGCPEHKIRIVKLGVEAKNILTPRTKASHSLQLIQVANMKEKKGHAYTLQAFAKALATCPNMHLTLVGSGEGENEVRSTIYDLQLDKHVSIIPRIDYRELPDFLSRFDVLIQPSLLTADKDTEGGAPIILLDAQAAGLPIIATKHADIPNVVSEGATALLSSERDIDSLAAHISTYYHSTPQKYTEMSVASINWLQQHFLAHNCAKNLQECYREFA
ncbi:MAG: glycosyltransferase [Flavobacteriaceae bacterium]|nr:glycosyltransferase [Flavobacteriaceae bacterium]